MKSVDLSAMVKWAALLSLSLSFAATVRAGEPPQEEDEPPGILSLLGQAWAAESGQGEPTDPGLALALYCRAGVAGSPEGYFRLGLLLAKGPATVRDVVKGRAYLALAAQLGHARAAVFLGDAPAPMPRLADCASFDTRSRQKRHPIG